MRAHVITVGLGFSSLQLLHKCAVGALCAKHTLFIAHFSPKNVKMYERRWAAVQCLLVVSQGQRLLVELVTYSAFLGAASERWWPSIFFR